MYQLSNISSMSRERGTNTKFDMATTITSKLSEREKEVLRLLANGLSSKMIADKLFLSVDTVNTHRKNIRQKTGVKNAAQAGRWWTLKEYGLIDLFSDLEFMEL